MLRSRDTSVNSYQGMPPTPLPQLTFTDVLILLVIAILGDRENIIVV
ncbi:hypothetical protein IQ249_07465 [Lusitaniella coriacea LEGE 07157]|uniref:Uncharacterized protein n=1 Tax=Lusitaniella coriacea LEGE 07157 TaxID=945747 RepID=A0A8J7J1F1_9CYAN|nr:hypothetical protein [Lusitaniella coriacea]MBE9115729.1 hypothetical protein [Lusitaniella coriacea LEGE 07157]